LAKFEEQQLGQAAIEGEKPEEAEENKNEDDSACSFWQFRLCSYGNDYY